MYRGLFRSKKLRDIRYNGVNRSGNKMVIARGACSRLFSQRSLAEYYYRYIHGKTDETKVRWAATFTIARNGPVHSTRVHRRSEVLRHPGRRERWSKIARSLGNYYKPFVWNLRTRRRRSVRRACFQYYSNDRMALAVNARLDELSNAKKLQVARRIRVDEVLRESLSLSIYIIT